MTYLLATLLAASSPAIDTAPMTADRVECFWHAGRRFCYSVPVKPLAYEGMPENKPMSRKRAPLCIPLIGCIGGYGA